MWNRIPDDVRAAIIELALEQSELSPRELAVRFTDSQGYFVSEANVYRLLKAHDLITSPAFIVMKAAKAFTDKTTAPNQMWQTDFTYVTEPLELALTASGCDQAHVRHKPRLLSDNGSSYISGDLAEWLGKQDMKHVRGAPYHPQTQGKIERCHQTLKNRILLENYFLPGDLEAQISDHFVAAREGLVAIFKRHSIWP